MSKRFIAVAACIGIAVGAGAGYILATKPEVVAQGKAKLRDLAQRSRASVEEMSEDVAMKTARATHNPSINQEWVARQWENAI